MDELKYPLPSLLISSPIQYYKHLSTSWQVLPFVKKHGLWPCMVAPTKIIAGLGLSLDIDILQAPGATGDYRTLLTSKVSAIASALSAPMHACSKVFVPGEDGDKSGRPSGYDFGFLHIKVSTFQGLHPQEEKEPYGFFFPSFFCLRIALICIEFYF